VPTAISDRPRDVVDVLLLCDLCVGIVQADRSLPRDRELLAPPARLVMPNTIDVCGCMGRRGYVHEDANFRSP